MKNVQILIKSTACK